MLVLVLVLVLGCFLHCTGQMHNCGGMADAAAVNVVSVRCSSDFIATRESRVCCNRPTVSAPEAELIWSTAEAELIWLEHMSNMWPRRKKRKANNAV